jgi:hypothetical protein
MDRAAALAELPMIALGVLAVTAWERGWPDARDAFEGWTQGLDRNNAWMLWRYRGWVLALFREVRRQGHFDEIAALLESEAGAGGPLGRTQRWPCGRGAAQKRSQTPGPASFTGYSARLPTAPESRSRRRPLAAVAIQRS